MTSPPLGSLPPPHPPTPPHTHTLVPPLRRYQNFLNGTFDNLFRSVRDSEGACRPALCAGGPTDDSPACQYYAKAFTNTTNVNTTLQWDPNFNSPADTKLVSGSFLRVGPAAGGRPSGAGGWSSRAVQAGLAWHAPRSYKRGDGSATSGSRHRP